MLCVYHNITYYLDVQNKENKTRRVYYILLSLLVVAVRVFSFAWCWFQLKNQSCFLLLKMKKPHQS
jgi:hypothetical protein